MAMAGGISEIDSTCGLSIRSRDCRAEGGKVSTERRLPSAHRGAETSEDFSGPDTPVTTISALSGRSRSRLLRLFCRAPRTRMASREASVIRLTWLGNKWERACSRRAQAGPILLDPCAAGSLDPRTRRLYGGTRGRP